MIFLSTHTPKPASGKNNLYASQQAAEKLAKAKKNKRLDYWPIISFFLFWLFSAFAGALEINDPGILKLGIFTLPALAAVAISIYIVHKENVLRER